MAESANMLGASNISKFEARGANGNIRGSTMREVLMELDVQISLETPQPDPPFGFESVDDKWLDLARVLFIPHEVFNEALKKVKGASDGPKSRWMEAVQLQGTVYVAIYPNATYYSTSVMMYAPLPRPGNLQVLRTVRVDLQNTPDGIEEVRGVYADNNHCYPVLDSGRLKCFNSKPAHPCTATGGTGESDWLNCSCLVCGD